MKGTAGLLLILLTVGGLLPALAVLANQEPGGELVVSKATSASESTAEHDLTVVSFEKLFDREVASVDTAAFSFEIVNQGLSGDTANWRIFSNNTTPDTGDDITIASGDTLLASGFSLSTGPGGISWDTTGSNTGDHAVTLSVAPVTGETNVENNFKTVSVTIVTEIIHDAAVMAIIPTAADGITPIGTADVINGTIINVNVRTINTGTVIDTFVLALADVTDNITIAELSVTLFAGEGVTFGLPWDTSGVSSGDHTLTASATLAGDADPTNNSLSTEVPVRVVTIAIFVEGADAVFPVDSNGSPAPLILQAPNITTVVQPITSFFFASADGILTRTTAPVEIVTVAQPLTSLFLTNADAITDRAFELVEIATVVQPFTEFLMSEADATRSTTLTAFSNPTTKESL